MQTLKNLSKTTENMIYFRNNDVMNLSYQSENDLPLFHFL